jgi:hypothetical protein
MAKNDDFSEARSRASRVICRHLVSHLKALLLSYRKSTLLSKTNNFLMSWWTSRNCDFGQFSKIFKKKFFFWPSKSRFNDVLGTILSKKILSKKILKKKNIF